MATYFIDAQNGLDTNNGTTELTPWKTLAKMLTVTGLGSGGANASHTIYLKKGSVFTERMTFYFGGIDANQLFTIDAYGYAGANPVINFAAGGQVRGISMAATCTGFFDFKNFDITGRGAGVEYGMIYQRTLATDAINTTLTNVNVYDIYDTNNPASDRNGLMIRGDNFTLQDSIIHDIATDAVWLACDTFTVRRNRIYNTALDGRLAGDCLQVTGTVNDFVIEDNVLDHTNSSIKHPLVVSGASAGSGGIIRRNQLLMKPSTTGEACYGLYCDQPNADIYQNIISGGSSSRTYNVANVLGAGSKVRHNLILCGVSGGDGLVTDGNNIETYNNTVVNTVDSSGSGAGIRNPNSRTGLVTKQNRVIGFAKGIERYSTSTWTEAANILQNNAASIVDNTGASIAAGTGTIVETGQTIESDYKATSTKSWTGIGAKYWTNARPSDLDGEAVPDEGIDPGCYQSTLHPFHPANL